MERSEENTLLDTITRSTDKAKSSKKRCWREIESIKEEFRLKRELEDIEHGYEYDELESDGDYTLFRHRYLGTYFVVAQRGPFVFGMEKLPDTGAITGLLERISESLGDGES